MTRPIKLGLVGLGKIANDQHLPAIAANPSFELAAIASRRGVGPAGLDAVPVFRTLSEMLDGVPDLDAVILCQPPQSRYDAACEALRRGKHVFLEKPPGATLSEVEALTALSQEQGVTLFASWHSRFGAAVEPARSLLAGRSLRSATITWEEDVDEWHPDQAWIWEPGGFGVFDPGINALSILTALVPDAIIVAKAAMTYRPGEHTPIAASLDMRADHVAIGARFDWGVRGRPTWDIRLETDSGLILLRDGGNRLLLDDVEQAVGSIGEYPAMYEHFARLVTQGQSDVDVRPLRLTADAFLCGSRAHG